MKNSLSLTSGSAYLQLHETKKPVSDIVAVVSVSETVQISARSKGFVRGTITHPGIKAGQEGLVELNDRSITRLHVGEKRNLSLPVGVLLYNAKVLFRDIKNCKLILCKAETLLFLLKVISFSFPNQIVACMLSMAKGIKVGSEVRVLRGKFSTQKGVVQASEG